MGFGDKLKDLRKQAQDAVAENRDKIHDAVDVVGTAVDQKTGGKHSAKIAKFGDKAGAAVDRFSEGDDEDGGQSKAADGPSPQPPAAAAESSSPSTPAPDAPTGASSPSGGEQFGGPPPAFDE